MTHKKVNVCVGETNAAILTGRADLSIWSDEELLRGQRKSKNGKWQGRKPKVVPLALHQELNSRRMQRAREVLNDSLADAVTLFAEVVRDKKAPLDLRMKAAKEITDRVMGRAPEHVHVDVGQSPWERLVIDAIVDTEVIDTTALEDHK